MHETIKLDGREFQGPTQAITANQNNFLMAHLRSSGALEILTDADGKKRKDRQRADLLLTEILLRGQAGNVLAGCLAEVGKKWNREEAIRNAEAFGEITDAAEQREMHRVLVHFVIAFFELGATSRRTSGKSSNPKNEAPLTESAELSTSASSTT
jgi:hypothetical protein